MLRKITCAVSLCAIALAAVAVAPLAARADDSKRLLAEEHFTTIRSFQLAMVYHSPKGEFDKQLTYVAPDKLRLEIPSQKIVAVTIGKYVWVRDPANKWHKEASPAGKDPMDVVHSLTKVADSIKGKTVTYVGKESLDGVETHVYRLQALPKPGYSSISEKLWLGIDGYPRKIVQSNGPYTLSATYSEFNAPLNVAAQ